MEASCIPTSQGPSIVSSEDNMIKGECSSSSSVISCAPSSNDYCSDHSDCDSWGPKRYEERGTLDELLSNASIRRLAADYDMEALVRELAAGTVSENT